MFVSKTLASQKFHLSLTAQLLIKCQLWILRRARFISYPSWVMSRQPLSFTPNGSFIYVNCKINVSNQVIPKWKQIVKENLFPYSKLRKSVKMFSALRHLEDVVSSKEYERSHKLCSHFQISKGKFLSELFCTISLEESPVSSEKVQNTLQSEAKNKLYLHFFVCFFPWKR